MSKYNWKDTSFIVKSAMMAALYAVLTLLVPEASFGPLQLRFSEILVLLVFYDKNYIPGLLLGCLIANCFSPMALYDVPFGTLASYLAFKGIEKSDTLFKASIFPVLSMILPAIGFYFIIGSEDGFFLTRLSFSLSEFVVVSIVGVAVFKLLEKNKAFMGKIKSM